jgi:hypothetical protein
MTGALWTGHVQSAEVKSTWVPEELNVSCIFETFNGPSAVYYLRQKLSVV